MHATGEHTEIEVDPERVADWLEQDPGPQLIDVREPHEHEAGHIAGSRHIELATLAANADAVERDRPVVFYCRVGQRSHMAAEAFRGAGYEAYTMVGGLQRWARERRALSPEDGFVADH
jgi:rhodanese-related sulfurtransferase